MIQEENKSVETEAGHEEQKMWICRKRNLQIMMAKIGEDQEYFAEGTIFFQKIRI